MPGNKVKIYDEDGTRCWSISGASKVTGYHRNTISRWIDWTLDSKLDMPIICKGRVKRKARIPIDEFLEWIKYIYQN